MAITYNAIATTTLSSPSTTISFTSISNSYTDLILRVSGSVPTYNVNAVIKLNNAASSMGWGRMRQLSRGGSVTTLNSGASPTSLINIGAISANDPFACIVDINNYSSTTSNKQVLAKLFSVTYNNYAAGGWMSTSAVNRVDFITDENMAIGTTATLFGILRA